MKALICLGRRPPLPLPNGTIAVPPEVFALVVAGHSEAAFMKLTELYWEERRLADRYRELHEQVGRW